MNNWRSNWLNKGLKMMHLKQETLSENKKWKRGTLRRFRP